MNSHATAKRTLSQIWGFSALSAFSILFWWTPLVNTFRLASSNDAYTHILLIFPLSVALIYFDGRFSRSQVWRPAPGPSLEVGIPILVLSFAIALAARWILAGKSENVGLSATMFSLVTWWIGSVICCFGVEIFIAHLFPFCMLLVSVPVPSFAVNRIVEFLQYQSATATKLLFHLVHVPVSRDGVMLSIPGLDIEVARECSSVRSSLMLILTTAVFAHLFLRSWWRKVLLIAGSVPLSIAKNGLRIFTIAELGTRVDPSFLSGKLHRQGGILFFAISVALMSVLLFLLKQTEEFATRKIEHFPTH